MLWYTNFGIHKHTREMYCCTYCTFVACKPANPSQPEGHTFAEKLSLCNYLEGSTSTEYFKAARICQCYTRMSQLRSDHGSVIIDLAIWFG